MENTPEIWFPHLGIAIQHLDRVAITVFGLPIYWYGVIIALGIFFAVLLVMHEAKRTNQNPEIYLDFLCIVLITAVIGARLYFVAFSWDMYRDNPLSILHIRGGGLAIYGAILASVLTAIVYTRIRKLSFWQFADTAAPSLILGQCIGRWGNFVNREAFGGYTDGLFAMRYLKEDVSSSYLSPSILEHIQVIRGIEYVQVHPTFLYESLWSLGLLLILLFFARRKAFDGQIFAVYLFGYACGRVWIEGLRTDQLTFGGVAVSQILSACLIFVAIALFIWCKKRPDRNLIS